jgi:hypothetical protein
MFDPPLGESERDSLMNKCEQECWPASAVLPLLNGTQALTSTGPSSTCSPSGRRHLGAG